MSGFKIDSFGGVTPRLGPRLLPNNGAQIAANVKLFSGELRSWKQPTAVITPSRGGSLKSLYRMFDTSSDYWLSSTSDVDYVKGPIAGDTSFKVYFTGEVSTGSNWAAGPRKTNLGLTKTGGTDYPHDWLEMGVPAPGAAPTITTTGGTSTTTEVRAYLYTYVTGTDSGGTAWNEEGPPSPVTLGTGKPDATWIIASLSTGTTGKYVLGTKKIYRTLTDSAGNTNYQLALDAVPIATTSTADTTASGSLGVICPTFINGVVGSEFIAPPSDLTGIIALPNGIMAGFSGNKLCFSEPFYPYAWPTRYQLATNYPIVSLGHYGQTLIVTTVGFPYAVIGARPDSMAMTLIEENRPCVSKRSTVSFPWGVMWATPDGLTLAGVGGTVNVTDQFMKRDEWQALCFPATIVANQYLDVYFGFFNNGTTILNFIFDRANPIGPLVFGNIAAQGVWNDPTTAILYLLQNSGITKWDADDLNLTPFDWKSKVFVLPKPVNFGAILVDADYGMLATPAQVATQSAADKATNAAILGTGNADTAGLTAWVATSSYGTGTTVKSVDGVKMAVCMVAGTSSSVEPTWPQVLGGSSTDGTVQWKQVWELQGVTKGAVGEYPLGYYQQLSGSDPFQIGTTINGWGFPVGASILVGGVYPNFLTRSLQLQVFAQTTGTGTTLVQSASLTSRAQVRLPRGFKSDQWEIRLSGNIPVRYWKIAETGEELARIP